MKLFGRPLRFGAPQSADVVIFDETNSCFVRKALNKKYKIAVFNMRPEIIWIGFGVALNFFRFIRQLKPSEAAKHHRGLARGILKQLYLIYIESCLVAMKPKAVVTFIDNDFVFHWLSKNCHKFPFCAIQNGSRLSYAAIDTPDYYLKHLFCYGRHEVNLFPKLGYEVEYFYPVGSLVASLHFENHRPEKDKYDLLIVSSWRGNIGYTQDVQDTMRSMKIMDQLLARYIGTRDIRAAVILRAARDSEHWAMPEIGCNEEEYYKDIFGGSIEIIETDFSKRNIFPLMQQSTLIVSYLSSALVEAFGIGKKILYCNFTGTDRYHQDLESSIVTDDSNYETFSAKLDGLLAMPNEEYNQSFKDYQKYYMSNPEDKSTYEAIAEKLDKIIEKAGLY